ncbi:MAG: isocitrate lyase/PEP mutase family protein [Hyphomicrobiales bacterium]
MPSAAEKARTFRSLHEMEEIFVMPNPWDIGSTKILAGMGFAALATTSAGFAFSIGRKDWPGEVKRSEALSHARQIVRATDLPVSADFENCYADSAKGVGETIKLAARTGLTGCSIEDTSGDPRAPIFEFSEALERVTAAVEACRGLSRDFILTARAENFLHDRPHLDDTLKRLSAFEAVGADVLYAPGLRDLDQIRTVCSALKGPVNVVMGLSGTHFSVELLQEVGVRRISLGSAFARAALGGFLRAAKEVREHGTFSFAEEAASFSGVEAYFD